MSNSPTPIANLGEFQLIKHLTNRFPLRHAASIKGIGDDAAVIKSQPLLTLVSTDLLVEGIHFDLMYSPLKHLGYKAVAVNVSDICAMNGTARQITVSLAVSSRFTVEALEELYAGIEAACRDYELDLIGGDTSSTLRGMVISITVLGEVDASDVCYRNTAQVGDLICVSGDLGAAYLGLQLLEREKRIFLEHPNIQPDLQNQAYCVGRQLRPDARIDVVRELGRHGVRPTAMIDISDGLSSDLLHICRSSGVGCVVFEENVPVHPEAMLLAEQFHLPIITAFLNGGEDYELLFTLNPKDMPTIENDLGHLISVIGRVTETSKGCKVVSRGGNTHDLVAQGWKHFQEPQQ